ncbi:MAG: inositol monophosphatase family protein [Candidatus Micrarchaeia archaeon]
MQPQEYASHAKQAARIAGKIALEYYEKPASSYMLGSKENDNSIVTRADKECEVAIVDYLSKKCPECGFIGEEGGERNNDACDSSQLTWIIDPIDGTTNFAYKLPLFAMSIGLAKGKDLIAGVVYAPALDEMFEASKGRGAKLNGKPIKVAPKAVPHEALIATDWPHEPKLRTATVDKFLRKHENSFRYSHMLGTAAISLAYVSCGRLHAYCHTGLQLWDVAAGACLIEEAGGKLFNWDKTEWTLTKGEVVATNGQFPL